jgi:hypothetical protein
MPSLLKLTALTGLLLATTPAVSLAGKHEMRTPKDKGKDKDFVVGALSVKVLGQSGKFSVTRGKMGKKKNTESKVVIEMDSLTEVNAAGKTVGKAGKEKHSLNSFASQEFSYTVEDMAESKVDANSTATAAKVSFESTIQTGSKIGVDTYLIMGKGEVGTLTERWPVQPGDMKFNIMLSDWAWCGDSGVTCGKNEVGAFIDLDIQIKGKKPKPEKKNGTTTGKNGTKTKPQKFDLGDGATIDLSNLVKLDGVWQSMPEGYPKMVTKGSKQVYTFRFPKFTKTGFYDPVLGFDENVEGEEPADGSNSNGAASSSCMAVSTAAAVLVLSVCSWFV